jgi:hypothetical protein
LADRAVIEKPAKAKGNEGKGQGPNGNANSAGGCGNNARR